MDNKPIGSDGCRYLGRGLVTSLVLPGHSCFQDQNYYIMQNLYHCISTVFPESVREETYRFLSSYMDDAHKYMEIDFHIEAILNKQEFYERAAFTFHNKPLDRNEYYEMCVDNYYSKIYISYDKKTGCIHFRNDDTDKELFIIENNFGEFIHSIAARDEAFAKALTQIGLACQSPDFCIGFSEFFERIENIEYLEFDFSGSMTLNKSTFFYRAQMSLEFPATLLKDANLPKGEWWIIGQGLGDEDLGTMEGSILVDKVSGCLAFYNPYNPYELVYGPFLARLRNWFVKPEPRIYEEHEFFIIARDTNSFVDMINEYKPRITRYSDLFQR